MASRIRTAEKTRCAGPQRAAGEAQKVASGFTAARNVWESTLLSTKPAEVISVKPRKESGRSERGPLKSRLRQPPLSRSTSASKASLDYPRAQSPNFAANTRHTERIEANE